MATEEGHFMTKVMPNKTLSVNLQSSLSEGSPSFSTIQDFAKISYAEKSNSDKSRSQGANVEVTSTMSIQKISFPLYTVKNVNTNAYKVSKDTVLTEKTKKQMILESHPVDTLSHKGVENKKNNSNENNTLLLKKRTHDFTSQDDFDNSVRSAFALTSNSEKTNTLYSLSGLSPLVFSHQTTIMTSAKSKTGIDTGHSRRQKLKLKTSLPSNKCLPCINLSKINPTEDKEINISMPSSVYGTQPSNIESVLTGLNLDEKNIDNDSVSDITVDKQIAHFAGGSFNFSANTEDDILTKNSVHKENDEKQNEKPIRFFEEKLDEMPKVVNDIDTFVAQKHADLQENDANSINNYSTLNISLSPDNSKTLISQKALKSQSLEQHISKLIAQNAAIVETLNPIRPRQHVRHLSFSENVNDKEHRRPHVTSKIRRFSEDLSSTFNNPPYLSNKSKLHNALLGHSESALFLNYKNSDLISELKKSSGPRSLNGICYTISENEKLTLSLPPSVPNISDEKGKSFLKPVITKSNHNTLLSVNDEFHMDFVAKIDKHNQKSENSIIKDLLLKPKHGIHSSMSESKLTQNPEGLMKQKSNDIHSTMYICKFCNIGFHSKDNLEAHQLHYCKLRGQFGSPGFSSINESTNDFNVSHETVVISDKLNFRGTNEMRNFDSEGWIPPLKQRKLSEPILSKSNLEVTVNRRRTAEFFRSEKTLSAHCIPSVSPGSWNSQMSGGKVQIFDEIGKKSTLHSQNQSALFTLLDIENHSSQSFSENGLWTKETGKTQKSMKGSSLPTVVVTISKPELNSGGTVMQVHMSTATGGSSLCVQTSLQTPLMATGGTDLNNWKNRFQSDSNALVSKVELSPLSKDIITENMSDNKLYQQETSKCNTLQSLIIESSNMSPISEYAEISPIGSSNSSVSQISMCSIVEKQEKCTKSITNSENDYPIGTSASVISLDMTDDQKITTDTAVPITNTSENISKAVSHTNIVNEINTISSVSDSINVNSCDVKVEVSSANKSTMGSLSDIKKKCPNPSRPTFLPLKKGITLVGSTLISPETPRPKKTSIQLYLGGHAYTSLGLKCSTRSTFCCIYRSQPMYVPQDTDSKLSMYSNWQVLPAKEELFGMTPGQLIGLYNSRQRKENGKMTISVAKIGNTLVSTHSSYWTFRMQDAPKEDLQKSPNTKEKATTVKDTEETSVLENVPMETLSYSLTIESSCFPKTDQIRIDENSNLSIKEHSHLEDTTEESCTSHSNVHSSDELIPSHPPKRVRHSEGNCTTNDEGTYVRGRGWGKYMCEECGIRCKKPSVLKKHIRTHTNLRPYKCYHCAFAFKTKGNLTKHMKSKAHFKKCIELGVVPVPTTVDDSQIDEEALDKQEKLDKDICPSLNTQEFEDGEDIDDDAEDTDHSENDEEDEDNSEATNRSERHEINNSKTPERSHAISEKEYVSGRDMTEKEGEAAQSLLHLSTCNVSQSSQSQNTTNSHSSDQSETSKLSAVLAAESSFSQRIPHLADDIEETIQSPSSSRNVISLPVISSKSLHVKLPIRTDFSIIDSTYSSEKVIVENKTMEKSYSSFENVSISPSPNSDYRERLTTMWTTSPQSWHGHSSLPLYQTAHINFQSKGIIWDGHVVDTSIAKPVHFANDPDQPMDLRICKNKDRIVEEVYKSDLNENWKISQTMLNSLSRSEQQQLPGSFSPHTNTLNQHTTDVVHLKLVQDLKVPTLQTNILNQQNDEESQNAVKTISKSNCQDVKSQAKPGNCHENSIPSYNVGRNDSSLDSSTNVQLNQSQYEFLSIIANDESVDSDSVQHCCPIAPVTPPIIEDNSVSVIPQENSTITVSQNISKIDQSVSHQQRECENKIGTGISSFVTEGKCTCAICNKTFTKPSQLRLHVNIHYFERPFRCDDCAISFRTNGHLEKHKRSASHYNKMHTNTSFGTPCADNPRPFKCTDCNIAFRMHGHLAKHLRSKMHIMKLECLGKLPFGMYAEMERTGVNFNDIDTTDCENSLESLQEIAQNLYTPQNAQQSVDLSVSSIHTVKPKAHLLDSSYSSATSLQVINTGASTYNNISVGSQSTTQALNLSSINVAVSERLRKPHQDKDYLLANELTNTECMTNQKDTHLDIIPSLHSRTCPCESCVALRVSFGSVDSCIPRQVKKEQWKLKDRLIAEFQEKSTHDENPR